MVEAKTATKTVAPPVKAAPPPPPKVDPNVAPPAEPVELTPEEKKAAAEVAAKEKEAQAKVARINENLAKDNSPNKIAYQVRNGEIAYMWVNEVPTRILTEDEMKALADMKPAKAEAK